jgi:hypothetical protein
MENEQNNHSWKEMLSKFFSEEELTEIEEWNLQRRLVNILCYQNDSEVQCTTSHINHQSPR